MPLCLWLECACADTVICPAGEDIPAVPASGCVSACVHANTHMPLVFYVVAVPCVDGYVTLCTCCYA